MTAFYSSGRPQAELESVADARRAVGHAAIIADPPSDNAIRRSRSGRCRSSLTVELQ